MVEIFKYMYSLDNTPQSEIKHKVKKKFNLEDWEVDIVYGNWKDEFMKPKYNSFKRRGRPKKTNVEA